VGNFVKKTALDTKPLTGRDGAENAHSTAERKAQNEY
jgi:hypothetical protein